MLDMFVPLLKGLGLGASLIIAIGAQNAFVLRQGIKRSHVFAVATVCFACDAVLIAIGSFGVGGLLAASETLSLVAAIGGAVFLIGYGAYAFRSALQPGVLVAADDQPEATGLWGPVGTALALSLLNPHVYLDTVVLLGSIAAQYPFDERLPFSFGAIFASLIWFYGLGYGATRLARFFRTKTAWRILDVAVGLVMWSIALSLILPRFA